MSLSGFPFYSPFSASPSLLFPSTPLLLSTLAYFSFPPSFRLSLYTVSYPQSYTLPSSPLLISFILLFSSSLCLYPVLPFTLLYCHSIVLFHRPSCSFPPLPIFYVRWPTFIHPPSLRLSRVSVTHLHSYLPPLPLLLISPLLLPFPLAYFSFPKYLRLYPVSCTCLHSYLTPTAFHFSLTLIFSSTLFCLYPIFSPIHLFLPLIPAPLSLPPVTLSLFASPLPAPPPPSPPTPSHNQRCTRKSNPAGAIKIY